MNKIKEEPEDYDDSDTKFNVGVLCRIDIKEESAQNAASKILDNKERESRLELKGTKSTKTNALVQQAVRSKESASSVQQNSTQDNERNNTSVCPTLDQNVKGDVKSNSSVSLLRKILDAKDRMPPMKQKNAKVRNINGVALAKELVKKIVCEICNKTFAERGNLNVHMRFHTGERPYKCNVCSRCFYMKVDLNRHMHCHTGERPFECNVCNKSFSRKYALKKHMSIHTGYKPYACTFCDRKFIVKFLLDAHIRHHTGSKPYMCSYCSKSFSQLGYLNKHSRIHTGERLSTCDICSKSFCDNYKLKRHMKTHN